MTGLILNSYNCNAYTGGVFPTALPGVYPRNVLFGTAPPSAHNPHQHSSLALHHPERAPTVPCRSDRRGRS